MGYLVQWVTELATSRSSSMRNVSVMTRSRAG
jgi:hypothetical protein